MAIGIVLEFSGVGQEKYDAVMKALGLTTGSDANWPEGILSHRAGKTADGWCVVDVWESDAAFAKFRETRLGPAFAKAGGMPEPRVIRFELYNTFPRTS